MVAAEHKHCIVCTSILLRFWEFTDISIDHIYKDGKLTRWPLNKDCYECPFMLRLLYLNYSLTSCLFVSFGGTKVN